MPTPKNMMAIKAPMAILILVLIGGIIPLHAQTQGFAPQPTDSYMNAAETNGQGGACAAPGWGCVNFVEGVNAQDLIVCAAGQQDATFSGFGSNPPWTFTDTAGFTWTMETANHGGTGGTQQNYFLQTGYTVATSSQATYRVSWSASAQGNADNEFNCVRFPNIGSGGSVTVDAFQSNTFSGSGSGTVTMTNTLTTNRTSDLIVSAAQKACCNGNGNSLQQNGVLGMTNNGNGWASMAWTIAPNFGSNSFVWTDWKATANFDQSQTIAFRVPIKLSDSALPQAGVGVAYSAQLHCYGSAVSNPTYALVSGVMPSGLTLHTATGIIDGTPSAGGTTSLGFTCTDGTLTSATDTLSLQIAGFGAIQQLATQSLQLGNLTAVNFPTSGCGDVITIIAYGNDTHGGTAYLQAINGASNYVKSSDNAPVQQYLLTGGSHVAPLVEWVVGPLNTSNPTITVANSNAASSALRAWASLIRGGQAVIDIPTVNSTLATSNGSISASYATVVPNEFLQVGTFTQIATDAFTLNSPFALDASGNDTFNSYAFGHSLVAGASSVTATTNISNAVTGNCATFNFCDPWTTLVTAIRPGFDLACANFNGPGDRSRVRPW